MLPLPNAVLIFSAVIANGRQMVLHVLALILRNTRTFTSPSLALGAVVEVSSSVVTDFGSPMVIAKDNSSFIVSLLPPPVVILQVFILPVPESPLTRPSPALNVIVTTVPVVPDITDSLELYEST